MNAIEVTDLEYRYSDGRSALKGLRLSISAGERVALLGPNGAGKTTLFLCLAGVFLASKGQVKVAGLDPSNPVERRALPRKLGIVFQQADEQLFAATVLEDVAFAPLNFGASATQAEAQAWAALRQVSLEDQATRQPQQLSGGEKRRAALAGVLVNQPEVLLLDEPTAGLDPRGRRELAELLATLQGTIIIATHELAFAERICTRGLILNGGQLHADGPLPLLLANEELLRIHGLS